jgi:phenylalanyl-tRNA synthetase beta chain
MKASLHWLRELCPDLPDDVSVIAARLTAAGLEVEATHEFGLGTEACVVAAVVSSRPHPTRAGLRLVTVDRGGQAAAEVVCGAPNVPEAGGLVVLAPLGAHLPAKGMTIERRTIHGVVSEGMLCSEAELGLGDEADGILILPGGAAPPGAPLTQAFPAARDTVIELGLTPNRADALGHIGLAREAAALFGVPFVRHAASPPPRARDEDLSRYVSVDIEDPERCPHYGAAVLVDVRVGPSPLGVRWRLASLGVRSISNVVDVTNLVMLEAGHPMHAFDLDRLRGVSGRPRVIVRRALEGERLLTLDGVNRTLSADDLVICDAEGPLALAGVMGGGDSEIRPSTTRVLLECAYFDPRAVRRSARRHALHTESSHRFERGVDWGGTPATLARASELVVDLASATAVRDRRVFEARRLTRRTVSLRQDRLRALLGADVPHGDAAVILDRLGFAHKSAQPGLDGWEVPSHRDDVSREVDLIEEIARVRGYDSIAAELPAIRPSRDAGPRQAFARRTRQAAVSLGLSEAVTYAFAGPRDLETVGAPAPAVVLRNPLREDQSVMRTSLLPGLLSVVAHARRHGERDARLFTVGSLFAGAGEPVTRERSGFAAVLAGAAGAWLEKPRAFDVWDAKALAEGMVFRLLRRKATLRPFATPDRPAHLHPRGAASVEVDGHAVGSLGPLHPDVSDALETGPGPTVVTLDLDAIEHLGVRPAGFLPLPRFPASVRDIAVVVRDDVTAGDVADAVREAAGELAEDVAIFDRFAGGSVPAGHTSLALHVVYRAADRTLTDAEVDTRHTQVVAQIQKRLGGQLRT